MPAFRFRAQPALDLRCREHDAAQRALARADAERRHARERLDASIASIATARSDADAAARKGSGPDLEWYRFWILRLDRERAVLAAALQMREAAVLTARSACLDAHKRREALERFKAKALAAHHAAEAALERKTIDELATRRFAVRGHLTEGA